MGTVTITAKNIPPVGSREAALGLPPVIVLNLFHSGLGIVRQLAGRGVRVVGLSAHPRAYGTFTRLCQVRAAPDSQTQPKELAEFLLNAAFHWQGAIIFPTRDADVLFLNRFRCDLERHYKLAIPSTESLLRVMNKAMLAEIASAEGIPVPRTVAVSDAVELKQGAEEVGFPCVVKPVSSVHWRLGNNWKLVGSRKAFRVNSLPELQQEYERVSDASSELLLQQWIPGATDQLVVWGGYLRPGSDPVYFTARKTIQSPEEFGTGCVVENESIPELLEPSLRLCRALGYEGIAEIEYKRDARDGRFKLIEINPRHWDWHQLGNASGINLTWTAYCHLSGRRIQPVVTHPVQVQWVAEDLFLMHLLRSLRRGNFGPLKAVQPISKKRTYSILSWKDPLPFLRYVMTTLLPTLIRIVAGRFHDKMLDRYLSTPAINSSNQAPYICPNKLCVPTLELDARRKSQR